MSVPDLRNYRKDAVSGFLRDRRGGIAPDPVSPVFDPVGDRRVSGMRRQEVAWAAGISLVYYAKPEQGRMLNPSPSILTGIMDALQFGDADRRYLRLLFGVSSLPAAAVSSEDNRRARGVLEAIAGHFPEATMQHILDRDLNLTLPDEESSSILFPGVDDPPSQVSLVEYLSFPENRAVSRRVYVDRREQAAEVIGLVHMKLATGAASAALRATVQMLLEEPQFRSLWSRYVPYENRIGTLRVGLGSTDDPAAPTVRACRFFTVTVPDDPDLSLVVYG